MLKQKNFNTIHPLEQSASVLQVRNLFDNTECTDQQQKRQKINKYGPLKYIFLKNKVNKIKNAFTEKLTRRLYTENVNMKKQRQKQQRQMIQNHWEGIEYPQWLQHILQILNLIIFSLLIIQSSFQAFLDQFSDKYSNNPITICFKVACFIVTLLRFIMKCTTVTFSEGYFINHIKEIIKAYVKQMRLFFDLTLLILQLLTIIQPFSMIISGALFFCLNLLNVYPGHQTTRIESAYIQSKKTLLLWSLLKIMFFNVFFAHFMAAIILVMAKIQPDNSWMARSQISQAQWYTKYIYAYYWATTMMMTVGFGDILPGTNNKQIMITSFLEMFSCIVLGYNISSIGNIVSAIRSANERVSRKVVVFQRMIKKDRKNDQKIDRFLEKQISNYVRELRNDNDNLQYIERDQLLSELPQYLRKAYYKDAIKKIFPSVMFFNALKPSTLGALAQIFKSTPFVNGEYINSQDSTMLILQKGKVGFGYYRRGSTINGQIMQTVSIQKQKNHIFLNPSSFLAFKFQKKYSLISRSSSVIWSIQFKQFFQILNQSTIDNEYYYTLLHKHHIDENQWEYILCKRCSNEKNNRFHSVFRCSKLTYLPIRNNIASSQLCFKNSKNLDQQQRITNFKRKRLPLTTNNILLSKKQSIKDYSIMEKSQSFNQCRSRRVSNEMNFLNNFIKIIEKTKEQKQLIHGLTESSIKKMIRQVLFQYQTGYQDCFWFLQCDQVHDYKFYFPQDNANRLFLTPVYCHPRFYKRQQLQTLAFSHKLRKLGHLY